MRGNELYDRVYGCLIGSAIGDAMGGPVELLDHDEISERHGQVTDLLPYTIEPNAHGPWGTHAGVYTDDTRLAKILASAMIRQQRVATDRDVAAEIIRVFHESDEGLPREFMEEYSMKAVFGDEKQVFGGQPTNGGIMAIAPFGVVNLADPEKALSDAFRAMFFVEGYSRYSAAMGAAAIAAAGKPGATPESIVGDMLEAVAQHKKRVEGPRWQRSHMYSAVAQKNERLIERAVEIASRHGNPSSLKQELIDAVGQQFFADGSETLAIAIAMVVASQGDYVSAVQGAVNLGRDNDSSACVTGAITGALHGASVIPRKWIRAVEAANAAPTLEQVSEDLTDLVVSEHSRRRRHVEHLDALL